MQSRTGGSRDLCQRFVVFRESAFRFRREIGIASRYPGCGASWHESANRADAVRYPRDHEPLVSGRWRRVTLEGLEQSIDHDLRPHSMELPGQSLSGEVLIEKGTLQVKNVVASIAGRGALAHESVVLGAHYDHVGMGGEGSLAPGTIEVHNGADDNASGTAVLLEVSRRIQETASDSHSRRRIVFVAFTGEERGLLGSRHYVAHPRFALESTAAMINLDMVGRMNQRQLIVYGTGSSSYFNPALDRALEGLPVRLRRQVEAMGPSDHQPFFERHIPVLHLFTGLHNDYHRPTDDFEKINTEGMVWITDIVYRLVDDLAKAPVRPGYIAVKGRANIRLPLDGRDSNEAKRKRK